MRITPLEPPYEPEVAERLHQMMGGVEAEPLALVPRHLLHGQRRAAAAGGQ